MQKRIYYSLSLLFVAIFIYGCDGVSQKEYDTLKVENETIKKELEALKKELDDIKFGAERLFAEANTQLHDKEYYKAKSTIQSLKDKHPSSQQAKDSEELLVQAEKGIHEIQEAERKAQEAERKAQEEDARREKERLANATRKLRIKHDDIQGTTWYYDKSTPQYTNYNSIHIYMGKYDSSTPWLRFRIQYASDDWLFIESFIIKTDANSYTINTSRSEMERDNGYGGIWEWYDVAMTDRLYKIVKDIISSKTVKIRHVGSQYHNDRTVTSAEKQGLQNILDGYEALGGKLTF